MKKRILVCLALLPAIVACLLVGVSAHPGKTDSSGGHYDHDTGEYHYHHGYSAHDHYDMDGDGKIDCPYNFDDKTSSNQHYDSVAEEAHLNEAKPSFNWDSFLKEIVPSFLGAIAVVCIGVGSLISLFSDDVASNLVTVGFILILLDVAYMVLSLAVRGIASLLR